VKLMAHTVHGDRGAPVLLLHGIGGAQAVWMRPVSGTADAIAAAGFRAVPVDLPGYGGSAALRPCDPGCMARQVGRLIDHLGGGPAIVVGHSLGGMVALELWAQQPGRVRGLVLACSSAAFGKADGDWQARFVADRLAPLDAGLGMAGLAAQLVPSMLAPGARADVAERAIAIMAQVPEATYRRVLQALVAFDRRAVLAGITVPVLCIAGEHDRTAPPSVVQGLADRIPGAGCEVIAGAGHLAHLEQPDAFDAAVCRFLETQRARTLVA
jgi:3-oxoadipate enol-lactonase